MTNSNVLFSLVATADGGSLGYAWIEAITIEQSAVHTAKSTRAAGFGPWAERAISNWYVCRTEHGLTRITADDLWDHIDSNEYVEKKYKVEDDQTLATCGDYSANRSVTKRTRAGKHGRAIACPYCGRESIVHNFSWSSLVCPGCDKAVEKTEFDDGGNLAAHAWMRNQQVRGGAL